MKVKTRKDEKGKNARESTDVFFSSTSHLVLSSVDDRKKYFLFQSWQSSVTHKNATRSEKKVHTKIERLHNSMYNCTPIFYRIIIAIKCDTHLFFLSLISSFSFLGSTFYKQPTRIQGTTFSSLFFFLLSLSLPLSLIRAFSFGEKRVKEGSEIEAQA